MTQPWRPAASLVKLREQVNALAPGRSTRSDGMIGDTAHAASKSDHNPDAAGIVRAFDITHDPDGGLDAGALAAAIVASRDTRVKYMIYNRRVIGQKHWTWTPYDGADPHTSHLHVSVVADDRADKTAAWRMPPEGENDMTPEQERKLDEILEELKALNTRTTKMFTDARWHLDDRVAAEVERREEARQ